ncbi:MAG TPA: response regulator [bacterium]|nr:response regulator [bacterium]HOL47798.1 response regulator [bacterium]HPQ18633.1 response regulator [bacterium]
MAKKIIIIDDEINLRKILNFNLKIKGYEIYEAENGLVGLNLIKQIKPDLILLDLMMPEMNGYQVVEELKKDEELSKIPIFILSAKVKPEEINKLLSMGVLKYITKPFNIKELNQEIENLFNNKT